MEAREKILEKATVLFLSMGVRNVTMDSIASDSGVSKRTIYELFKDKDDLVVQSLRRMIIKNNEEMMGIITETENVIEAIFLIMKMEERKRSAYSRVFTEDIKKYFPPVYASLYSCNERLKQFSASFTLLEKGIGQGIVRKDIRLDLVDNFIHELIGLIHNSERLRMLKASGNEVLVSIFLPYFRGICTPKGVGLMDKYFVNVNDNTEQII